MDKKSLIALMLAFNTLISSGCSKKDKEIVIDNKIEPYIQYNNVLSEPNYESTNEYCGIVEEAIMYDINMNPIDSILTYQLVYSIKSNGIYDYVLTDKYGEVYIESKHLYRMENTFLEVCLDKQYVRLFNGTDVICLTPTVTGMEGTPTNEGYFYIYSKEECAILKGEDYESYVDYWMPFDGGIGLHDASWRSEFGSDIYLYNGSHGCVNLPYDAAKIIYENTDVGTPVLVHK